MYFEKVKKTDGLSPPVLRLFVLVFTLAVFLNISPSLNAGEPQVPEWYLEAERPQNEVVSVATSELKAILNGLGDLAGNLDPNVETMRQDYGDQLSERKIRLLSNYQFDRLSVSTQVEYYREVNYRDETRTLQQKLVRARFPLGDTTAKITYYLEENRGGVSANCRIRPDTKALENPREVLNKVIEENGIRREKFAGMNNRYFVLLSYR